MGFLDFLLRRQPDPTRHWPQERDPLPTVRVAPFELGKLRLGDGIESARFLGRPDKCHRGKLPGCFGLDFTEKGLRLQFEEDRLTEVVFRTGYDTFEGAAEGQPTCVVRLEDGSRLSQSTSVADVERYFGPPTKIEADEDETRVHYQQGNFCMDFEFNSTGELGSWTAYLDE